MMNHEILKVMFVDFCGTQHGLIITFGNISGPTLADSPSFYPHPKVRIQYGTTVRMCSLSANWTLAQCSAIWECQSQQQNSVFHGFSMGFPSFSMGFPMVFHALWLGWFRSDPSLSGHKEKGPRGCGVGDGNLVFIWTGDLSRKKGET